jgi:hypothetical protein
MKTLKIWLALAFIVPIYQSCKHDSQAGGIDLEMLQLARQSSEFVWYKHSPEFLNKSAGSGHSFPMLRTRYNAIAAAALDSAGNIPDGAIFPEGSLIVKELSHGSSAERYAVLLKRSSDPAADERGWVWGYINSDETAAEPASQKGAGCKSCHSQAGSVDYMLMKKFFP